MPRKLPISQSKILMSTMVLSGGEESFEFVAITRSKLKEFYLVGETGAAESFSVVSTPGGTIGTLTGAISVTEVSDKYVASELTSYSDANNFFEAGDVLSVICSTSLASDTSITVVMEGIS